MRRVMSASFAVAVFCVFLVPIGTPPAAAATRFVDPANCNDGTGSPAYCTIQAAINAADNLDVIQLSAGTHVGTGVYVADMAVAGGIKSLTFQGAGVGQTIIDGQNARPGFRLVSVGYTLSGLTIRNGYSTGSGGGLMLQGNAIASLTDVRIENSKAESHGGGIYVSPDSHVDAEGLEVVGNESLGGSGGGIFGSGTVSILLTDSLIADNVADDDGGGIYVEAVVDDIELDIARSVLSGNEAGDRGGAVYASLQTGTVIVTDTEIIDNDAGAGGGGGLYLVHGHHTIERTLFAGNDALGHGGGLHYATSASANNSIEIVNSTFSGNNAVGDGGGAYTNQIVANSTFVGNTATVRGGGVARTTHAAFQVRNTIMAGNTAPNNPNCYQAISLGYNLTTSFSFECFTGSDATNIVRTNADGIPDAGLKPLADNGGFTRTHAISWQSQARNAGHPAAPGSEEHACESEDQRDTPRGADRCDIGAYELIVPASSVLRYAGANRFETAVEISAKDFPNPAAVSVVFVAVGNNFPDALAGAAAAGKFGAPLLLVNTTSIPDVTKAELTRLDPDEIVVLGGEAVISPAVFAQLGAWGTVGRWAGPNRYATAAVISGNAFADASSVDEVVIATGANFPDALGGGPVATAVAGPVLLVPPTGPIPAEVAAELTRLGPTRITVLGGESAVSAGMFTQLAAFADTVARKSGANRYATAIEASKHGFGSAGRVYVAVGTNFPDALAGAAAAGFYDGPVLLVPSDALPADVAAEITRLGPHTVIILGGTGVVSVAVENALKALLGI